MTTLYFDVETSRHCGNMPWQPDSFLVSLCAKLDTESCKTWIFNHNDVPFTPAPVKEIQALFDKADIIVAHNLKFDLHWIHWLGIDTSKCRYYCTMVAEYLINGQQRGTELSLKGLSVKYGVPDKIDAVAEYWDSGYETNEIPLDVLIPYGEQDVINCMAIYHKQIPIITRQKQAKIVKLRCESLRITQQIEANGMKIDVNICKEMSLDYANKIEELQSTLKALVKDNLTELRDVEINFGSNEHLSSILFGGIILVEGRVAGKREGTTKKGKIGVKTNGLGFTPREGTETKKEGYYQVDVGQLSELKAKPKTVQYVFLECIRELSKVDKMKSTYCDGLLEKNIDGIIHPTINECVTATGRYSSSNPNSQNLPREGTSPVKGMFITRY